MCILDTDLIKYHLKSVGKLLWKHSFLKYIVITHFHVICIMLMAKSNVEPWSNYLGNYDTPLSETYLQ